VIAAKDITENLLLTADYNSDYHLRPAIMTPRIATLFLSLLYLSVSQAGNGDSLLAAASLGRYQQLRDLIADGADVNAKNPAGKPALSLATYFGNTRCARALLGAGANPNQTDNLGNTPLMDAAAGGRITIIRLLIEAGANVNLKNNMGLTALARATTGVHAAEVTERLKQAGAEEEKPKEAGNDAEATTDQDAEKTAEPTD